MSKDQKGALSPSDMLVFGHVMSLLRTLGVQCFLGHCCICFFLIKIILQRPERKYPKEKSYP